MKPMNSGNRLSNRICVFTLLLALMLLLLTGSSSNQAAEVSEGTDGMFYAHVNGSVLPILAADNSSADAFLDLLKAGDVISGNVDENNLGGFWGSLKRYNKLPEFAFTNMNVKVESSGAAPEPTTISADQLKDYINAYVKITPP